MSQANALEVLMLKFINEERAAAGLTPLRFNGDLNEASEDHSQWMLDEDVFSHTGEGGSSAGDRIVKAGYKLEGDWTWGENIGWQSERGAPGLEDDVRDIHESLMNSPGHRANILNPDYEEIGIGIERGDFGGYDGVVITQNFGTTDAVRTEEPTEPDTPVVPDPEMPVADNDTPPEEEFVEDDPVIVAELPEDDLPDIEDLPDMEEVPEAEEPVAEGDPDAETPADEVPEDDLLTPDQPEQEEFAFDLDAFLTDLSAQINALIEDSFRLALGDNDNFWFTPQEEDQALDEEDDFMVTDLDQDGEDDSPSDIEACDDYQLAMDWDWNAYDPATVWDAA